MGDEDWKNARQWIISTGISMENKSMQYSEELLDFAESLRDGIILCAIVNKLKPGCVQYRMKVNNPDHHEFLCLRNIGLFLRACVDVFHLSEKNLFEDIDLYHLTNFKAVVNTLSLLSKKREATELLRWTPFSTSAPNKKKSISSDDDVYGTLSDIIDQKSTSYENASEDIEDNIYDEVEKNYSSTIYDTLVNYKGLTKPSPDEPTLDKRDHIIKEILDTEEGYLKHLKVMVEVYIPQLKVHITPEDKETVFLNTEKIFMLHLNFHRELSNKKIFKPGKPDSTGKIDISAFIRYKEQFLMYSHYCTHLDDAQKRAVELLRVQGFRTTVEELNKKLERKFPLREQLAVSFQRVLKYPLLLRDLNKNTPEVHEDHASVQNAYDAMDDVAKFINEYKRDMEQVSVIDQIQSSLRFDMPVFGRQKDYGRHIKDGELQVQFDTSDKKEKRFSFLFEHALLLCKAKGDNFEVKEVLDLVKFVLEDGHSSGKGNYSHFLKLLARSPDGISELKNCKIFTKTQQMKISWISAIKNCIELVTLSDYQGKLNGHSFVLTTFEKEKHNSCSICNRLLAGLVSQGFLCSGKGCSLQVHQNCLVNLPPCQTNSPQSSKGYGGRSASHFVRRKEHRSPRDRDRAKTLEASSAGLSNLLLEPQARGESMKQASLHKQKSLDTYSWFAGVLSRDQAADMLKDSLDGSYLIRESERGGLVLSIQYNNSSFHIKIAEKNNQVYLTDAKQFSSVDELLTYYESNTLGNSFPTVQSVLTQLVRKPAKRMMTVIHNWDAKSAKELSLKVGDVISVLRDDGNWWVGISSNGQQGYFPSNYVV